MSLALLAIGLASESPAQPGPKAGEPWRTLETEHFRIHFQTPAEEFARAVTARVEAARLEILDLVGHFPDRTVDLVVGAPAAAASARGLPFREGPRVVLHATPPSSSRLEDFDDWIALSLGYELAHIALLSRPPENRALSLLARTLPVTSQVLYLPDWLPAAYAASIDDRLSCAGAPRRPLDSARLRQLAASNRLPDLDDLEGEAVGAEFLTWLESWTETGPRGSLPEVWRSMTASAPRTFRASVRRTFGLPLEQLYEEWRHELEASTEPSAAFGALDVLDEIEPLEVISAPHVGSDGAIVVLLRRHDGRPRLAVLDPDGPDGQVTRALDLDGVDPTVDPRWLADGSVVFVVTTPEGDDHAGSDLFRWWPETGRRERLTSGAVLRAADGSHDGAWVAAVENRWGASAIVRIALDPPSAAPSPIMPLVAATAGTILDTPRPSPDGRQLAFLRHRGAGWRLVVRELATGAERELGDPSLRALAWPAWSPDGRWIVVTAGDGDSVRLKAWSTDSTDSISDRRLLTEPGAIAMAGAFDPSASTLVHLAAVSDPPGVHLVRQPWLADTPGSVAPAPSEKPSPTTTTCPSPAPDRSESRNYGRGPTTYSSLLGGGASPSVNQFIGGWRGGDVIGRWEAVAVASGAPEGAETGGIVSAAWRGWSLPVHFHGYGVERWPSRQPEEVPGLGELLDVRERAFALETEWRRATRRRTLELGAAALAHKLTPHDDATVERYALLWRGDSDWIVDGPAATTLRLGVGLTAAGGWTDSEEWRRYGGALRAGASRAIGRRTYAVDASWSALRAEDARLVHDRLILGGTASSLIPSRLDLSRIHETALPAGTLIGDRWESQRLTASYDGAKLRIFGARHRLWDDGSNHGPWLRLAGLELAADRDARPIFRLPSSIVRVGAGYVFDEPFRHRWMYWAGLAWTL